jgi:hypothetical protein
MPGQVYPFAGTQVLPIASAPQIHNPSFSEMKQVVDAGLIAAIARHDRTF